MRLFDYGHSTQLVSQPARVAGAVRFWEHFHNAEKEGGAMAYRCPNTVLILSRKAGTDIGNGIRGFAVRASVFDDVEGETGKPLPIDLEETGKGGFIRLYPRMLLRKGAWEQDIDLLRFSKEIALGLIELFGIDPEFVWERVRQHAALYHEGERPIHGGALLDIVLDEVSGAIGKEGPLSWERPERMG